MVPIFLSRGARCLRFVVRGLVALHLLHADEVPTCCVALACFHLKFAEKLQKMRDEQEAVAQKHVSYPLPLCRTKNCLPFMLVIPLHRRLCFG